MASFFSGRNVEVPKRQVSRIPCDGLPLLGRLTRGRAGECALKGALNFSASSKGANNALECDEAHLDVALFRRQLRHLPFSVVGLDNLTVKRPAGRSKRAGGVVLQAAT